MEGLFILWLILAVIVLFLMYYKERKNAARMRSFIDKLFRSGRVSYDEHYEATVGKTSNTAANMYTAPNNVPPPAMQQPSAPPPVTGAFAGTYYIPPQTPYRQMSQLYQLEQELPPRPAENPAPPRAKTNPLGNPAAVMLFIGAALVILSGVIFSGAAWHRMSDLQRVGIIALAAVFFFAVSCVAHRKLKLESTGLAFYMLGGVFTSISFLTLGIFGLLGEWLSTDGGGSALLYALFSLIITAFASGGALIYRKVPFVYSALYGAALSVTLTAIQITKDPAWWSFVLNCVSAVTLAASLHGAKLPGKRNKNVFRSFSACLTAIYAVTALPELFLHTFDGWRLPTILTVVVWTAQIIYYSVKFDSRLLRNIFPFLTAAVIAESSMALGFDLLTEYPAIRCCIAAAGFIICFTVCGMVGKLSAAAASGVFTVSLYLCGFAAAVYGEGIAAVIAACAYAAAAVAAHGFGRADGKHSKGFAVWALFPLSSVIGFTGILIRDAIAEKLPYYSADKLSSQYFTVFVKKEALLVLCISVLIFAAAMFYRYSRRIKLDLRTAFSDFAFTVSLAVTSVMMWYYCLNNYAPMALLTVPALELLLLTAAYVFERKPKFRSVTYTMRRAFPLVIIWFVGCLCSTLTEAIRLKDISDVAGSLTFTVLSAAAILCFVLIPKIRTVFSDIALPVAVFIGMCGFADPYRAKAPVGAALLASWLIFALVLAYSGLKSRSDNGIDYHLSLIRGESVFVTIYGCAVSLSVLLGGGDQQRYDSVILASLMTLIFAAFFAVQKFGSGYSKETKRRITQFCSFWAVGAGASLMAVRVRLSYPSIVMIFIFMLLALILILLCSMLPNDLPAAMPIAALFFAIPAVTEYSNFPEKWADKVDLYTIGGDIRFFIGVGLFAVLLVFSRIFHRGGFCEKREGRFKLDIPAIGMAAAVLVTAGSYSGGIISSRAMQFTAIVELAVFALNLIRGKTSEKFDRWAITVATAAVCALVWAQPFGDITNSVLLWKLNILPLLLFGIMLRLIWKKGSDGIPDEYAAKVREELSFASFLAAFVVLLIDALSNQTLANTIIVLVITLTIMLSSFALRSGRWFVISTSAFLGLTLYITRDFFSSVQWWVYLLAAGILLISISAANEYLKTRGDSLKNRLSKMRSRWK